MVKQPIYEEIQPSFGSSFNVIKLTEKDSDGLPYWHFHPEFEIVFISNGRGKRQIGNHISHYENGDLLFVGPNLPHLGFAQELWEQHTEIVVQMKEDFLGAGFLSKPELADISRLFERAKTVVAFHGHTKWEVGQILQNMPAQDNFERLVNLLKVLQLLAKSGESQSLNINYWTVEVKPQEHARLKNIYTFVEKNFHRAFLVAEVAKEISMSEEAFCRFFKKLTHKTFITFLNEFRIANACQLLSEEHRSISDVCHDSGFNNLSHFNKQFKNVTGSSPTEYRKNLHKVMVTNVLK